MNTKRQFRVLYRQFLFRLMDAELLAASARGDASVLFGQFAALLVFFSLALAAGALSYANNPMLPGEVASGAWHGEHIMVEITMLTVGIFAVFSWDSTFPDRRDVLVLAPLPVRGRTLFSAKIAAVATALGLTVVVLNSLSGFAWPLVLAPAGSGIVGTIRFIAAFWITLTAAGAFLYCAILGVQGVVAQLPRGWFLRVSSFLQIAAFALFLGVVLLQPSLTTAQALGAPENQRMLGWLPTYWFLGLLSELSGGFAGEAHAVMAPLAWRAVWGLGIALVGAGAAFVLSYLRTLRRIAEEPDILPGSHGGIWLPRFGSSAQTALTQFAIRTLGRSRQHRMNLAFYLGVGFALMILPMAEGIETSRRTGIDVLRQAMNMPMLVSSVLMLSFCVLGTRVAFSRPLDLRANWLFRVTPVRGGAVCLSATRRALLVLAVFPVWIACAATFLRFWPWPAVAKHLLLFGLFGSILADLSLATFRKIPFTCSYLPGKSRIHVMFVACIFMLPAVLIDCAQFEQRIMSNRLIYGETALIFALAAIAARTFANRSARRDGEEIQFEEFPGDELVSLGLSG